MGRIRNALRALFGKSKLSSEIATDMANKRWNKENIKEEIGTFSQVSKLMSDMDTFKQEQIQRELEFRNQLKEDIIAELQTDDNEGGESSISDDLVNLMKIFGGVTPQTAAQAMPPIQPNILPQLLQNPKVKLLINAFDKIPEDKLKELLEKLESLAQ